MSRHERYRSWHEFRLRDLAVAAAIGVSAMTLAGCAEANVSAQSIKVPIGQSAHIDPATITARPTGYDISWPQCSRQDPRRAGDLPQPGAFAIVGVNGQTPKEANTCFNDEAAWASRSTGGTNQPRLSLYVTSANPAQEKANINTWPTSGVTPYGPCDGGITEACSFAYGRNRAEADMRTTIPLAVGATAMYIDVEEEYTWDRTEGGQARNAAALEGMVDTLRRSGAEVGFYSTQPNFNDIAGPVTAQSPFAGMSIWARGAHSKDEAVKNCAAPSFTGGPVVLSQWTTEGGLDRNVSCE